MIVVFDITKSYVDDSSLGLKGIDFSLLFLVLRRLWFWHKALIEYWVDKYNKLKYMGDF